MSRVENSLKNSFWSIFTKVILIPAKFFARAVFIYVLGDELLGVNSLFTDVLALFSFVDMGFGTAITFFLYKPIARHEVEHIKSLLALYRKIYNVVIFIITMIGCLYIPFLSTLKTMIPLNDLRVYYLIFLVDNIVSYIWAYRETYLIACQKAYKLSGIQIFFSIVTTVVQIAAILTLKNFVFYLICGVVINVIRKVWINYYIVKLYPETKLHSCAPVEAWEKREIYQKVRALAGHKIANLSITQTDSLIVSVMIGTAQWGLISNYLLLKTNLMGIVNNLFSAVLPSMGDLVASEGKEKQLKALYTYNLINFWVYAFCFSGLVVLSSPFIALFFGEERVVSEMIVFLLFFNMFFAGFRDPVAILREALGFYTEDLWITVLSAIVNLVSSIIFVKVWGIAGVFVGTICSTLVVYIFRPVILFRKIYCTTAIKYFFINFRYMADEMAVIFILYLIRKIIFSVLQLSIFSFSLFVIVTLIVANLVLYLFLRNDLYFKTMLDIMKSSITRGRKK